MQASNYKNRNISCYLTKKINNFFINNQASQFGGSRNFKNIPADSSKKILNKKRKKKNF